MEALLEGQNMMSYYATASQMMAVFARFVNRQGDTALLPSDFRAPTTAALVNQEHYWLKTCRMEISLRFDYISRFKLACAQAYPFYNQYVRTCLRQQVALGSWRDVSATLAASSDSAMRYATRIFSSNEFLL